MASEMFPLIKTGGLADVVGALPEAVAPHGVRMTTLLPGYPSVMAAIKRPRLLHRYTDLLGVPARLLGAQIDGHPLILLDAPALFDRPGTPYGQGNGPDWDDNWHRFAALGKAGADLASGAIKGLKFDVLHAHDWQAAMAPAYLRYMNAPKPPSIITIHNIAFQGQFGAEIFASLGLPPQAWSMDGVEYYGGVGLLKAGLTSANAVTTVSPTYASEIRSAEFGMGLEGLIAARGDAVHGILNGIDRTIWDPALDSALAATFTARSLTKRMINKRALEAHFALDAGDGPLFVVISRLTWQKGMDVLAGALDHLVAIGARLALLGTGDAALEAAFAAAAARHRGKIGVQLSYDEQVSHLMQGGGDAILIPSRFEPCGLTQLYGLAYGCVPVVARTGGLADSIINANEAGLAAGVATGLQFDGVTPDSVARALRTSVRLYGDRAVWKAMQLQGMKADFSWQRSGQRYAELYDSLLGRS